MQERKDCLVTGEYFHIYSRSIAGYIIFNDETEFRRFLETLDLLRFEDFTHKYSEFLRLDISTQASIKLGLDGSQKFVEIVAYCIMPTHIHLILKQLAKNGISKYIAKLLNSYTRYFNQRHKRSGPLWTSKFKSVLIKKDNQLLHLTRYLHLNPTSAGLVSSPEDWPYSSYSEYLSEEVGYNITETTGLFDLTPEKYREFVNDRKRYQKELSKIKAELIDDYTG